MSSCQECWDIVERHFDSTQVSAPPAGYEDEVLVNIDAYDNPFPDTSLATLEGKAAAELYRRAVLGGFPDGEFKGNRMVNRAEIAKFILLARGLTVPEGLRNNGRFADVLDDQWYTGFAIYCADLGYLKGDDFRNTLRPADGVNTAELLIIMQRAFDLPSNLPHSYADVSQSEWFNPVAGIAERYDTFPHRGSELLPGRPLTRDEVAVAIYQYLQKR